MKHGEYHIHQRERIHLHHEEYPHPDPKIRLLDNIVMCVAVIMPLTSIPQIYNIWFLRNITGVSLLTWSLFFIMSIPMLIYGFVHKEKVLILLNALWLIMYAFVIVGIVIYG